MLLGDIDGDGLLNMGDADLFVQALTNLTTCDAMLGGLGDVAAFNGLLLGGAASVPEPSAWVLAFFALAGVARRRRCSI